MQITTSSSIVRFIFLSVACLLLFPSEKAQAAHNIDAKIAAHIVNHVTQKGYNFCAGAPNPPCNEGGQGLFVQGETETYYDLYLFVADGDTAFGVSGAAFGISYNGTPNKGLDVLGWILCADAEYGSAPSGPFWPDDGSGNLIVWDELNNCQKTPAPGDTDAGVTALLGILYVYAYDNDIFRITRRPYISPPVIEVTSCGRSATRDTLAFPQSVGRVAFGPSGGGYDPCQ